jgi:hypothetical protein
MMVAAVYGQEPSSLSDGQETEREKEREREREREKERDKEKGTETWYKLQLGPPPKVTTTSQSSTIS